MEHIKNLKKKLINKYNNLNLKKMKYKILKRNYKEIKWKNQKEIMTLFINKFLKKESN
jgi:hypothetical protein